MEENNGGLVWGPLVRGVLVKRYQRFLADVRLGNRRLVTAHCPNTGSMLSCSEPGRPVYLSPHNNPSRRLRYTWEMIEMPGSLVGVNTRTPNLLVKTAAGAGKIPALSGYDLIKSEVTAGDSRLDLVLEGADRRPCFVEIKNCTLVEEGTAFFPDAVTQRGRKHLANLAGLAENGRRAVIFFLIQRIDARLFRPADHIDPEYGRALRRAVRTGVEVMVYDVNISLKGIDIRRAVDYDL